MRVNHFESTRANRFLVFNRWWQGHVIIAVSCTRQIFYPSYSFRNREFRINEIILNSYTTHIIHDSYESGSRTRIKTSQFYMLQHEFLIIMTTSESTATKTILTRSEDWEKWFWELQANVNDEIWLYIDSDSEELPLLEVLKCPELSDIT